LNIIEFGVRGTLMIEPIGFTPGATENIALLQPGWPAQPVVATHAVLAGGVAVDMTLTEIAENPFSPLGRAPSLA
jgi:hypothetical protein